MHETRADLLALQALLDRSNAAAGPHLRSVFTEPRHLDAVTLTELLVGVQILNLATVSAAGRPLVAPVDGIFFRGHWYYGSSPDSVRMRHLRARPAVSASHTRGEALAVIVHGDGRIIELNAAEHATFRQLLLDTYVPVYGPGWESFAAAAQYARIDPRRLFAVAFDPIEG
jgi:nitroimidazol reductase NimA-like FMN-containing flavoprotein (pyridoxamine 5'-phosphate oxidase superfamily)